MKIRVYDMAINEDDETGVDINSFVNAPAHMRSFETYNKGKKQFFAVDEEKRMVLGVAILANFLIFRSDKTLGDHYVKFPPSVVEEIQKKFFKNGFNKNTNVEHEFMVDGAVLTTSYIVDSKDPRTPGLPAIFAKQGVTDGSWILGYYIENEKLWQDCKKGIFTGFSVEGYFDKVENQIKSKTKMADKTKDKKKPADKRNLFERLVFGKDKEEMSEATTAEGQVLSYEGDLATGTVMMITDAEGNMIPAPAGDHQVEVDGKTYAITLDDKGAITAMEEAAAMTAMEKQMAAAINKVVKAANAQFTAMQTEIDALTKEVGILKGDEKFSVKGKKTEGEKKGFRAILKKD